MENPETYNSLRFERRRWNLPRRLIFVSIAIIVFTLLWKWLPQEILFWLLIPIMGVLTWMATYGWRQVLASLIVFLHRLEQF